MKYTKYLRYVISSFFVFRNPIDFLAVQAGFKKEAILKTWSQITIPVWGRDDSSSVSVIFLKNEYGNFKNNQIVFDVGANKGYLSVFAAQAGASVYAFEPDPETFLETQKVINSNKNLESKIKLFNLGIGSLVETRSFYHDPNNSIASSFVLKSENVKEVTINCTTVQTIISENKIDKIDVFKIDAEGAEYEIFYSMEDGIFKKISEIRMEYHNVKEQEGYSIKDLSLFLEQKGYRISLNQSAGEGCGIAWFVRKDC